MEKQENLTRQLQIELKENVAKEYMRIWLLLAIRVLNLFLILHV